MSGIGKFRHYARVVHNYVRTFGLMGLPYLAEAVFLKTGRLVRVRRQWAQHPIFLRLATSDVEVFGQVFLDREYGVCEHIQRPVHTILDAGANIGLTSIFFALRYPAATIIAIEPERSNYDMLVRNCSGYANIHCVCGGLWGSNDKLQIRSAAVRNCSFSVESSTVNAASVQGYRVSTLLKAFEIHDLSILKMDIEGAEVEVFSDAGDWGRYVENIIVELHDRNRSGCTEAFRAATHDFVVSAKTQELTLATRIEAGCVA